MVSRGTEKCRLAELLEDWVEEDEAFEKLDSAIGNDSFPLPCNNERIMNKTTLVFMAWCTIIRRPLQLLWEVFALLKGGFNEQFYF